MAQENRLFGAAIPLGDKEVDNSQVQASPDTSTAAIMDESATTIHEEEEQRRIMAMPSMHITEQEREWALAIKRAVESDEELHNLTDLEYVHHAIVLRGDVETSLRKMRGLQLFRQEYGINDTIEQAMDMLQAFLLQQPGLLLSVDKARTSFQVMEDDLDFHYLMVFDFAKINPKAMKFPRDKRDVLGAIYYIHHATQTNPNAMRQGILFIAECEGMSFDNISLDFIRPIWQEMKNNYPVYLKEISWLRAATAATIMYALAKPFFPLEVRSRINLGCEFQAFEGRLDELFLTRPTEEENVLLILQRAQIHLLERFRNAHAFRLT